MVVNWLYFQFWEFLEEFSFLYGFLFVVDDFSLFDKLLHDILSADGCRQVGFFIVDVPMIFEGAIDG